MAAASSRLEALVGPKQDTLNQAWKEDKSSFGFKMLMKMGWSEGKGLGKELQGAATHVTVSKKTDSAGLGAVKDDTGNLGWTEASATFDSVLSRLQAAYGGDAAAAKAAKRAEKKRKKKEKKEKERATDQSPAVVAGKASMLLRHPKLLKSKNIRAYSAHDMKAILGIHRSETTTVTTTTTTTTTSTTDAASPWASLAATTVVTRTEEDEVGVVVEEGGDSASSSASSSSSTSGGKEFKSKKEKKQKKKEKKRKREEEGAAAAVVEENEEEEGEKKKSKKAKKEKKKRRKE